MLTGSESIAEPIQSMDTKGGGSRWGQVVRLATRRQRVPIVFMGLVMALTLAGTFRSGFSALWAKIDPILTLGTLGAALMVWLGEAWQDWERALPQRITVEFRMGDRVAFRCERAPLLDEAPRAWAQQIGRQMNESRDLKFWPVPEEGREGTAVRTVLLDGKWVRHRTLHFELREWPQGLDPEHAPRIWGPHNEFGRLEAAPAPEARARPSGEQRAS